MSKGLIQEDGGQDDAESAHTNPEVLCGAVAGEEITAVIMDRHLDGASDTEEQGNGVVDDSDNQAGRNALVLLADAVAEHDGGGGVAHVHAERHDNDGQHRVGPVDLVDGAGRQ